MQKQLTRNSMLGKRMVRKSLVCGYESIANVYQRLMMERDAHFYYNECVVPGKLARVFYWVEVK